MSSLERALSYHTQQRAAFKEALFDLLRIPSISTDPAHAADVRAAAEWVKTHAIACGMNATMIETAGHPAVYAETPPVAGRPTVLVYGHYDVQPPDPLDLWDSPPFEPVEKHGNIYARGACDDKGQMFMHLKAVESWMKSAGAPPVNVKFLIEGEEESGSAHLPALLKQEQARLAADVVLVSDTALFGSGEPSITTGLRGLAYCEVTLTGPNRDLHSGVYGGGVDNPANALARLIAQLHDETHRITIPGFYEDVLDLSEEERDTYQRLPFDEQAYQDALAIGATRTEEGYSILEATTARPTLDVNGIWGGYTGAGAKTVLPSKASAKISMRLVPNQTPEKAAALLEAWFKAHVPPTMKLSFTALHGGHPALVDLNAPALRAAAQAMEDSFGKAPYLVREGGSIPVVADFKHILGLDTVLLGFGLNSDAIHSPNEHFGLDRFHLGIETSIRFMARLAEDAA